MSVFYSDAGSNSISVLGRPLARVQWSTHKRARVAAEMVVGAKRFTDPTIRQAAALCRVQPCYVAKALHDLGYGRRRKAIKPTADDKIIREIAGRRGADFVFDLITS